MNLLINKAKFKHSFLPFEFKDINDQEVQLLSFNHFREIVLIDSFRWLQYKVYHHNYHPIDIFRVFLFILIDTNTLFSLLFFFLVCSKYSSACHTHSRFSFYYFFIKYFFATNAGIFIHQMSIYIAIIVSKLLSLTALFIFKYLFNGAISS